MNPARLIFVGKRRLAMDAARELGVEILLWSERPPGRSERPSVRHHLTFDSDDPLAGVDEAAAAFRPHAPIAAVLALTEGSVRAAAALRERLGIPGPSLSTALRCADKQLMKQAIAGAGIPCARFATTAEGLSRDGLIERLGLPMVVKPRIGHGGRGASILREESAVPERLPEGYLAESFVAGVEMSVETLIADGRRIFTNPTEYLEPGWANLVPRSSVRKERAAIEKLLDRSLAALELRRGMAHLELFLTGDGPVFGEIAARPPGGHILRLVRHSYDVDLWQAWLRLELGEEPRLNRRSRRFSGVRLLYPGAGRVRRVAGVEEARAVPGIVEATARVEVGRLLPPRVGVGQEAGLLVAVGPDRATVVAALETARGLLAIEVEPDETATPP